MRWGDFNLFQFIPLQKRRCPPDFLEHYGRMQHIRGCHNPGSQWINNQGHHSCFCYDSGDVDVIFPSSGLRKLAQCYKKERKNEFFSVFNFLDVCASIYPLTTSFSQHLRAHIPLPKSWWQRVWGMPPCSIACSTGRRFAHCGLGGGFSSLPLHSFGLWWTLD